jgi:benzylsuccinate CoA-transferase BbsF subunit
VLQALVGLSHLTGYPDRPPMAPGIAYTDYYAPQLWALAIMSALVYRRRTSIGQFIDGSDFEAAVDLLDTAILDYQVNGTIQTRRGNRHPGQAPHGVYPCQPYHGPDAVGLPAKSGGEERWVAIAVQTDREWEALRRALGDPTWAREERFATLLDRLKHQDELDSALAAWTSQLTAEEAVHLLQKAGVRAGVVQNARDFQRDPQLQHRQHFWELADDPNRQWFTYEAPAYRLSETPVRLKRPVPRLGQHNDYVFSEVLGLSDLEFAELVEQEAIK